MDVSVHPVVGWILMIGAVLALGEGMRNDRHLAYLAALVGVFVVSFFLN